MAKTWVYTYSVDTTIACTDVRVLFALLAAIRAEFTGPALEFKKYRKICAKEGFVFKDVKRRLWVPEEEVP